ncbi:MAG: glycosyltransferase family 2 protein [Rhodopirellula sp.]|nr:glycosyltransferase family 2 protein [Rhodopirellula sp.]
MSVLEETETETEAEPTNVPASSEPVAVPLDLADVVVIIPALNEEASLPLVLADLPTTGAVIVVDNRSRDRTGEVATHGGARVFREEQRGYGQACLRGLAELRRLVASEELPAPKIVAFVDADYSDHPNLLPLLVAPIHAGEAEFVLGSRLLGQREPGAMPPQSVYGNKFACWLMRVLFGHHYTDLGPFRAIDYAKLEQLGMADENFGWTVEMQLKALQVGLRIQEIPVPYRCRVGVSKISGTVSGTIKAGYKILYTIAKYGLFRRMPQSGREASIDGDA